MDKRQASDLDAYIRPWPDDAVDATYELHNGYDEDRDKTDETAEDDLDDDGDLDALNDDDSAEDDDVDLDSDVSDEPEEDHETYAPEYDKGEDFYDDLDDED